MEESEEIPQDYDFTGLLPDSAVSDLIKKGYTQKEIYEMIMSEGLA